MIENKPSVAVESLLFPLDNEAELATTKYNDRRLGAICGKYRKMEDTLKEIQWMSQDHFCPVCTAEKCKGHWSECPIGRAIKFDLLGDI